MNAISKGLKAVKEAMREYLRSLEELEALANDRSIPAPARKKLRDVLRISQPTPKRPSRKTSQDWRSDATQHERNAKLFDIADDAVRAKRERAAAANSWVQAERLEKAGK